MKIVHNYNVLPYVVYETCRMCIDTEHVMLVRLLRDEMNAVCNRYWTSQCVVCWTSSPIYVLPGPL